MLSDKPVILTIKINNDASAYFTGLRKQYFPAERNYLDAHLTLFHHLPGDNDEVLLAVKEACRHQKNIKLSVVQVASIGAGVAFKLESPELSNLHKQLQQQWQQYLIPQDKQKLWPHITIQNKVAHAEALQLKQFLEADFKPFNIEGSGFILWEYLGGPWNKLLAIDFEG